jgi:hypothetical protein
MGFSVDSSRIWPVPPDWNSGVSETLGWGTNVMRASATGVSFHLGYQDGPSRTMAFEVAAWHQERRIADMLLAGHRGRWLLPIWPDVQWLGATLASGSTAIPCATDGFDFVEGGQALLFDAPNDWEVVVIDTVASDHLGLVGATIAARGARTRLYPLRSARVQDGAEERMQSDQAARRRLSFDLDGPCDWPGLVDPTTYLGHPVLEARPDESEDPTATYSRLRQTLAFDGARPLDYDLADLALRAQQTRWKLQGRTEHAWFRSLLYTLQGQLVPMWLPSFAQDLQPAAAIAGSSTSLSVEWAGYTLFAKGRHNRRDLRFELDDGTVLYRRVSNAVEAGATETLTLSSALDTGSIAPERIRQVSIMCLATLASDTVEIEHVTDAAGVARATLGWQSVVPDA